MVRSILFATVFAGFALAGPIQGQTLRDALAQAYRTNPTLEAERARLRSTDEQLLQARGQRLPTVALEGQAAYSYTETDILFGQDGERTPRTLQLTANQVIWDGGRIGANVDRAKSAIEAGRSNLESVEQQVFADVITAFVDVRRDLEVVRIRQNNVSVLERQLTAARDRFEVGEITRTDVSQAQARLASARANLQAAEAQLAASRAAYTAVVGSPPGSLDTTTALPGIPVTLADALALAEQNNPDIAAARAIIEAADAAIDIAAADYKPQVSLGASVGTSYDQGFGDGRSDTAQITGQIRIPLFQGGTVSSRVRSAKQDLSRAKLQLAQTRNAIGEQVTVSWNTLTAARAVIVASQEQVRAARDAFEGVEEEARVGLRTTLDVLDAEQEFLQAQLALVSAQRDEYVAATRLLSAIGLLNVETLGIPVAEYQPGENLREISDHRFSSRIPQTAVDTGARRTDIFVNIPVTNSPEGGQDHSATRSLSIVNPIRRD